MIETAERETEIPREMSRLQSEIERLDNLLGALGSRIAPVLSPASPVEARTPAHESSTQVSEYLITQQQIVQRLADMVQDWNSRLEL